jgi:hypothetical protein
MALFSMHRQPQAVCTEQCCPYLNPQRVFQPAGIQSVTIEGYNTNRGVLQHPSISSKLEWNPICFTWTSFLVSFSSSRSDSCLGSTVIPPAPFLGFTILSKRHMTSHDNHQHTAEALQHMCMARKQSIFVGINSLTYLTDQLGWRVTLGSTEWDVHDGSLPCHQRC